MLILTFQKTILLSGYYFFICRTETCADREKMNEQVNSAIVAALQQGDHKAFETVFTAYYGRMCTFIRGLIKSDTDAEELTEELFVNLWTNRASLDPDRSFNAYLHTIAHNAAINYLRHKTVQNTYSQQVVLPEELYSPEDELVAQETALLIDMEVDRMPEQRRQIFRLSKQEGLKNEEIATRLRTTKRNVESQLSTALKQLRTFLGRMRFLLLFLK